MIGVTWYSMYVGCGKVRAMLVNRPSSKKEDFTVIAPLIDAGLSGAQEPSDSGTYDTERYAVCGTISWSFGRSV